MFSSAVTERRTRRHRSSVRADAGRRNCRSHLEETVHREDWEAVSMGSKTPSDESLQNGVRRQQRDRQSAKQRKSCFEQTITAIELHQWNSVSFKINKKAVSPPHQSGWSPTNVWTAVDFPRQERIGCPSRAGLLVWCWVQRLRAAVQLQEAPAKRSRVQLKLEQSPPGPSDSCSSRRSEASSRDWDPG